MSYMNNVLSVPLEASEEQFQRLLELQAAVARACNVLAPVVQQTRVWNRVALHHLMYRQLRASLPELGSQMACNAIYSVSRTCRALFQNPQSPFHLSKLAERKLPLLRFADTCPVYFDRHTLSVKDGQVSMFTLDGRMRFALALSADQIALFRSAKLREIVLSRPQSGRFVLTFQFGQPDIEPQGVADAGAVEIPEYVVVDESVCD